MVLSQTFTVSYFHHAKFQSLLYKTLYGISESYLYVFLTKESAKHDLMQKQPILSWKWQLSGYIRQDSNDRRGHHSWTKTNTNSFKELNHV